MRILLYKNTKRGLIIFGLAALLAVVSMYILFFFRINNLEQKLLDSTISDLKTYSNEIDVRIASVATDLLLMEDLILSKDVLDIVDGKTVFTSLEKRSDIEDDLMFWMKNRNTYDQIRIIDNTGQEVIRVNYNNGRPNVTLESDLQNKATRYYFTNAINLSDDTVYMSKFDLNVENGEIEYIGEVPKSMLRLSTTLYKDDGTKYGMLILNYLTDKLFHGDESEYSSGLHFEVINEDGYFIHSVDKDKEYGFMFDDKKDEVFTKYHDYNIFDVNNDSIEQVEYEDEVYTSLLISNLTLAKAITNSTNFDVEVVTENSSLTIFGELEFNTSEDFISTFRIYLLFTLSFVLVAFVFSRLLDEILFAREKELKTLQFTSSHDMLTGLPNRSKLHETLEYLYSRQTQFTLLFMDFDGFKKVNDTYGHKIGDEVLIEGSKRILNAVRATDIVARLGGDEFVVVLVELMDNSIIDRIKNAIIESVKADMIFGKTTCNVGISIGVAKQDGTIPIKELMNSADHLMYEDKETKRKINWFFFFLSLGSEFNIICYNKKWIQRR